MTQPISRTDLSERVDRAFYERFPQAPRPLSATRNAEQRRWWVAERDRQLEEELTRIYWARWPDAPIELDDTSPEWQTWRTIQRRIRDELRSNAPEPEDVRAEDLEPASS